MLTRIQLATRLNDAYRNATVMSNFWEKLVASLYEELADDYYEISVTQYNTVYNAYKAVTAFTAGAMVPDATLLQLAIQHIKLHNMDPAAIEYIQARYNSIY